MVVGHFLRWMETARVAERAAAAAAMATAYIEGELAFEDRCAAEAALTLLLDDPSSKVRLSLADALSMSRHAPVQIIAALASDQPEVASLVLGRSPLLTDADLIDRVASGSGPIQRLIAARAGISMALSAAIAEVGEAEACRELLNNSSADIASLSFRRIAERLGDVAEVREAMLSDGRLPSDCRHTLLVKLGEALKTSPLVVAMMGAARAERVTREACVRSSLTLIENTPEVEFAALIEHLRIRGDLTASFLVRAVAHGKIDFFGCAVVALTGQSENRVRALLAGGQDVALASLFRKAGLSAAVHAVILKALKIWREVANGKRLAGAQEVSWMMLQELGPRNEPAELASLLKSIHLGALRENARGHALSIAAA
ncbi:DUF2336 domain-containing protein [Mesorhizobium sp. NBSH29]|uniref:DUF2336 domain-containing protein n=1 Tax=Mesorhizobium sp. NBSH29 TaxID=2654249 RepID=UPI00189642F3|nr:DUF2336 domain-containing protein [Mesorhizobium sp. NBSH29]QPC87599.1 DUF2336 domain-containing protein [Mesorhizobium sp. NBSH29]